jgi:hypothetical protein
VKKRSGEMRSSRKPESIRSRSYSRSREKNKRTVHSYSEEKRSMGNTSE